MIQTQQYVTIAVMAAAVVLTRCLPFLCFPSKEKTPHFVRYLGDNLAGAVFGMLVVYCLKDVRFLSAVGADGLPACYGLPQLAAIAFCIMLHLWRGSFLLSIAGGTLLFVLINNI